MSTSELHSATRLFDSIGLGEMDQVQLMNRVDTKFVFTKQKLIELLPVLKEDYFILKVGDNLISRYESLYYDHELVNYDDHHRKRVNRYKIRYRTYIESKITFLEVKHKFKGRTDKRRISVDKIPSKLSDEHYEFIKTINPDFNRLKPSLMNRFSRITLVSKQFDERLTLDIDLSFEWEDNTKLVENIIIAELKQGRSNRTSPFYKLMKNNYIRPLKISKYCVGIIDMYGKENVKYNRFKKKLLQITKLQANAS
ncbi:MAG: polyphosphate polymerase domain-containing protein [Crocinitomicaceae bacterium]|nr:polyphosphate polymerase domain-containing protein [Crocinitomicaceae bacterium]MDG1777411.1 polyphosphate polymerase domain-containing protein [Crocinitomicaceae bacterium]